MILGNVLAIAQRNIKRMLAYSSIAHAGYILMALVPYGNSQIAPEAVAAAVFYLVAYSLTNFGAWAVVIALEQKEGRGLNLDDWIVQFDTDAEHMKIVVCGQRFNEEFLIVIGDLIPVHVRVSINFLGIRYVVTVQVVVVRCGGENHGLGPWRRQSMVIEKAHLRHIIGGRIQHQRGNLEFRQMFTVATAVEYDVLIVACKLDAPFRAGVVVLRIGIDEIGCCFEQGRS